jgi:nucleoside-diphosphate-sugar epimerase
MKVLVSGGGGFLGSHVCECLLKRGHSVRAIVRPTSRLPFWQEKVELYRADLRTHDDLSSAFEGIDAVLHLAAATSGNEDVQFASSVVATERFLKAMSLSSVKRLVHVSSLVVYDWSFAKEMLDENTPLLKNPYAMGGYAIAKTWQERIVAKFADHNAWDVTIMRPGFIWGPEHAEIAAMGRHIGKIYVTFGPLTRLPLSHVVNCADCLVTAAEKPAAIGQAFNVVDGDNVRVWRYVLEYARRTDQRGVMIPVPYRLGYGMAWLASSVSRMLFGSRGKLPSLLTVRQYESQFKPTRFSNQKLEKLLGWEPRLNFDQALSLTYDQRRSAIPTDTIAA